MRVLRALRVSAPLAFAGLVVLATAGACDKKSAGTEEPDKPSVQLDPPAVSAEPESGDTSLSAKSIADADSGDPAAPTTTPADTTEAATSSENTDGANKGSLDDNDPERPQTAEDENKNKNKKKNKNKNQKTSAKRALPAPIFGKKNPGCGRDPGIGKPIKSFSLKTTKGKTISSANLRGRVVLLNFWGTWCKPCLKELPEFDRLYRRYRKNGLLLLAIATDSDPEPVIALAKERKLAAKIALGGEELANSYKSPNFPFSFVVDKKGIIQASYRGFKPECLGQLEQDIRAQLAD
ncbi:MAG TPA: TlpA family protein disulfide reductase [Nannocystis exedens]|nr:TlpA family protein disulfide reductase [Nannocystis exedens]